MNSRIERLIQEISTQALAYSSQGPTKLLVYGEVAESTISADILWEIPQEPAIQFRFAQEPIRSLLYELWQEWSAANNGRAWATFSLRIDQNAFTLDCLYPDQLQSDEGEYDRRPRAILDYFGHTNVDYSTP